MDKDHTTLELRKESDIYTKIRIQSQAHGKNALAETYKYIME